MTKRENTVRTAQEAPVRERMSKTRAQKEHRERGYKPYTGPKLVGPRFELALEDERFPAVLRLIPRPPEKIYGVGNPEALQEGLAVVGARKATPYGRDCARRFGLAAARRGIVIISGGARGCDSAAHRAALEAGAPTVVFLGGGCDYIYPAENFDLFQRIVDAGGAVVSEHEWGFPPLPYAFRDRNRLIAGLARATLVVEAGLPSGTFSTADEALAASKEVLAVPGAITSKTSRGTNTLILQGATPIIDDSSFEDALFMIFGCMRQQTIDAVACGDAEPAEGEEEARPASLQEEIMLAVASRPTSLEELCAIAGHVDQDSGNPLSRVAEILEAGMRAGTIVRLPDGRFAARVYVPQSG